MALIFDSTCQKLCMKMDIEALIFFGNVGLLKLETNKLLSP